MALELFFLIFEMPSPQFKRLETSLDDVHLLERTVYGDERGMFGKLYNVDVFTDLGIPVSEYRELIYSKSQKNVVRGMHYQAYPFGTAKLVSVVKGAILDVVVGIGGKYNTRNYGKTFSTVLSEDNSRTIYVPDGYAHGFKCLEDDTIVVYLQSQVYNQEFDKGIHWQSFGFDWDLEDPILSERDKLLPPLSLSVREISEK